MKKRQFLKICTTLVVIPSASPEVTAGTLGRIDKTPIQREHVGAMDMTPDEMKVAVRRFNVEVIEKGNRAAFDELMDREFVNRSAPEGAPAGPESMWNTFQNVLRPALANLQVHILDQLAETDKVTTRKTITGVHAGAFFGIAPTGRMIYIDVIDIVRLRDGRYLEHWGINNLASVVATLKVA